MGPLAEKEIETVENDLKAGQSFFFSFRKGIEDRHRIGESSKNT